VSRRRAAGDQDYEHAMKTALSGLPLDGDFFWRHGWADVGSKKLLAILAGASQMSAYVGRLAADSDAQGKARAPLQTAGFDSSGTPYCHGLSGWYRNDLGQSLATANCNVQPGQGIRGLSTKWG